MDRALQIFVVEDNPLDLFLLRKIFSSFYARCALVEFAGGAALLHRLEDMKQLQEPFPDLIITGLHMPDIDGFRLLMSIKTDWRLKKIPVVVLSGSELREDIERAYALHASGYIVKPYNPAQWKNLLNSLVLYWGGAVASFK